MSINLDIALKKDYADYKKLLSTFEKEKSAIDKKILALDIKYEQVLDLVDGPRRSAKPAKRARRGQSKELVVGAIKKAKKSLKAFEIIENIATSGATLSAASVRQQLPQLTKENVLKKNKDKSYALK